MNSSHRFQTGWLLVWILSLIPVVLWLYAPTPLPRFSNPTITLSNIGQILGLVGFSLFGVNLLLSARLRWMEKLFHGLNNVYRRHGQIGQTALVMMLFHPLFLLAKYTGGSWRAAALFLLPSSNWPQNFGWLALTSMIILIVLTLYLRPKYNIWKWTHKFLGGAFFLASLHVFLIPSDTTVYPPLKIYLLSLATIGLLAFTYRTLFGRWLVKRYRYTVTQVTRLNTQVTQITLQPQGAPLRFIAGQFVFISFAADTISGETHPFSISSSPTDAQLTVTIKNLGDYTDHVARLPVGARATVEGPFGSFSYQTASNQNQIWIAGGIGITPFISMARSLPATGGYHIDLYYCTKNQSEAVYLAELQQLSPTITTIPVYSDEQVRLTADLVKQNSGALDGKDIFICAPPTMIQALKQQFMAQGVKQRLIYSEEFDL